MSWRALPCMATPDARNLRNACSPEIEPPLLPFLN